ncbi:endonuclease III domain-containing protein [Candidatus Poribacteria bacterium]|nr:MAG: endonuclease III domain-containing protein [Candidatus Poribacteria bacterium]
MREVKLSPLRLYKLLFERYGPQGWWPGETPFEVAIGAILTQATAWRNAERAIENLKSASLLSPRGLFEIDERGLAELIRPAGFQNLKARRIKSFVDHLFGRYGGSLERMFSKGAEELREELLSIKGIGRETADAITLYAAGKPTFVIDSYTRRLLSRLGMADERAGYEELRRFFMENLPPDLEIYKEYHALIVRHCKEVCRKRPLCERCHLKQNCLYAVEDQLDPPESKAP